MTLRAQWTWEFDAPRERLWDYVADTDWVNRHAGLPRISAHQEPSDDGGVVRRCWFRQGPILVEWIERPTIWKQPEFFEVERLYQRGPLARFATRTQLDELGPSRTRIIVDVELEAANGLFSRLLPLVAAQGKRGADRAFALAAKLAVRDAGVANDPGAPGRFAVLAERDIDPRSIAALAAFVRDAEDRELDRMRPYELADRWGLPRQNVLRAFLAATREGLFNLSWSVLCPSCRGASDPVSSLAALDERLHCPSCNIAYDAVFDRSVEVTFDAKPLGRGLISSLYCIASPRRSPHVRAQFVIEPAGERSTRVELASGSYEVNAVGVAISPFAAVDDRAPAPLDVYVAAEQQLEVADVAAAGSLEIVVHNGLFRELIVRVEDGRWPDSIVTAAQVTALQEFRDLFSSQILAPGAEVGIESLSVLFTDLVASTALYSRSGDAVAFRLVNDHFRILRKIVAGHNGAIVKTLGDAIMAVFVNPADALDAALEMDRDVQTIEFLGRPLRLRVGLHVGPCVAIRANETIDYFGSTVNLASRLAAVAGAGEVAISRSSADRPDLAARLSQVTASQSDETLAIAGLPQPVGVVRVSSGA